MWLSPQGWCQSIWHAVTSAPIPPLHFCLCQHLETLRVALAFLIRAGCKSVQRCVDGWSIPVLVVFYVFIFLQDATDSAIPVERSWSWSELQLRHSAMTMALGIGDISSEIAADTWFGFGGDTGQTNVFGDELSWDLSLTGGLIRTRNDPCKVWLKRTGVLLQFLVDFHFKREVLCITNQEGMLRGSTLPLKEWKHGYHFPFPSHGIIYQGVQLQAEAQGCLVSHWPLLLLFLLGSFLVLFLCHFICDSVSWKAWELHIFLLSPFSFRLSWGIWWSHVQKAKLLSWWPFVLRLMWWRKKSMWGQLGREAGSCLCFVILLNVMGSVALPFRSKGWWLLTSCTCSSVEAAAVIVEIVGIAYGKWKV